MIFRDDSLEIKQQQKKKYTFPNKVDCSDAQVIYTVYDVLSAKFAVRTLGPQIRTQADSYLK